tara:strand:- start:425 stop:1399 length:975 start_codon:yes stop_codon:yes gene_type:complete
MSGAVDIEELEAPLEAGLAAELTSLWEEVFDSSYEKFQGTLRGEECEYNRDLFFVGQRNGEVAGTCHVALAHGQPRLGGFGEVVTSPQFRRQGIATALCGRARDVFCELGGEALFLGTGNPEALRVYHRLGWRKLAGANLMVLINGGASPEVFMADYYRQGGEVSVCGGTAAARVPMIPLLICPHDWRVLDANVGLFSTRYVVQGSCMGLYPRYEGIVQEGGAFFEARTDAGRLVGLSTARPDGKGKCRVDGFAHGQYDASWDALIQAALDWGGERGLICEVVMANEDEDRRARFAALGFVDSGAAADFELQNRSIAAMRLERS